MASSIIKNVSDAYVLLWDCCHMGKDNWKRESWQFHCFLTSHVSNMELHIWTSGKRSLFSSPIQEWIFQGHIMHRFLWWWPHFFFFYLPSEWLWGYTDIRKQNRSSKQKKVDEKDFSSSGTGFGTKVLDEECLNTIVLIRKKEAPLLCCAFIPWGKTNCISDLSTSPPDLPQPQPGPRARARAPQAATAA